MALRTDVLYRFTGKTFPTRISSGRFTAPELVIVDQWCRIHYREANHDRGFCDAGTEDDVGGWYEWDCDVVYLKPKDS